MTPKLVNRSMEQSLKYFVNGLCFNLQDSHGTLGRPFFLFRVFEFLTDSVWQTVLYPYTITCFTSQILTTLVLVRHHIPLCLKAEKAICLKNSGSAKRPQDNEIWSGNGLNLFYCKMWLWMSPVTSSKDRSSMWLVCHRWPRCLHTKFPIWSRCMSWFST